MYIYLVSKGKTLIKKKPVFRVFSDLKKKNYYMVSIFILLYLDTIVIILSLVAVKKKEVSYKIKNINKSYFHSIILKKHRVIKLFTCKS